MKLPRDVKRGEFMMAKRGNEGPQYELIQAFLIGGLAVHKANDSDGRWRISHIRTGLYIPCATGRTLPDAVKLARKLNKAVDWKRIRRTKNVAKPRGMTRKHESTIREICA